jgi:hypothetical protein
MVMMERLLSKRIEGLNEKKIPVSQQSIQHEALNLYEDLQKQYEENKSKAIPVTGLGGL